jgi:hypothetical protein
MRQKNEDVFMHCGYRLFLSKLTRGGLAQDCAIHPEKFNVELKQC